MKAKLHRLSIGDAIQLKGVFSVRLEGKKGSYRVEIQYKENTIVYELTSYKDADALKNEIIDCIQECELESKNTDT